jgi:hypothetical protein
MKIPILINNFNLFEWPKNMVEELKSFECVGEIIIVDNNSTYPPLLEWYETTPCKIFKSEINYGHYGVWKSGVLDQIDSEYYVVSDPDLDLSNTPRDCLIKLKEKLETHNEICRIGLSLCNFWDRVEGTSFYYWLEHMKHEFLDETKLVDDILMGHIVDTTFAMYITNRSHIGKSCALNFPYCAYHIPWNYYNDELDKLDSLNPEFFYYLKTAGYSSSFKRYIDFNNRFKEKNGFLE